MISSLNKFILTLIIVINGVGQVFSHSVQVQYCVSCSGDLRIWVEHWHGSENPASTTMTIEVNINGVVNQITSAPGGGVMNMTPGSLPGCSSPITYAAGCPGDENTYNDWVYYDFPGLPPNVPISFTILSGNTVFTTDACGMYPLTVNFNISFSSYDDQNICSGGLTSAISMDNSATWTNNNPAIGLAASGTGTIPSFTPVGPPGTTATISFTNTCSTGSFDFTILPQPNPVATTSSNGASTNSICLGNTFDFTNSSTILSGNMTYDWDFGDGNTSNLQNPSNLYSLAGTYNATLIATSDSGCIDSLVLPLTVNAMPVAAFDSDSVCLNLSSTLTDLSTIANGTISAWEWDLLNNNTIDYTSQNVSHIFPNEGTFPVQLIVSTIAGCKDSIINNVEVFALPQVAFSIDTVCLGVANTFTDQSSISLGSNVSWDWTYGDGNVGSGIVSSNTYANTGSYVVTLDVTSDNACVETLTGTAVVYEMPSVSFNVSAQCEYDSIVPLNTSSISTGNLTYAWDFGDGSAINTSSSPGHLYSSGTYQIILFATSDNSCINSDTNNVFVYETPSASFSVTDNCLGLNNQFTDQSFISNIVNGETITSWNWDIDNNSTIDYTQQNPSNIYPLEGGHNATLIVETAFGCVDTFTSPVTVWPLPVVDFSPTEVCEFDITQYTDLTTISNAFTNNSLASWSWDFGGGFSSTQQNPTFLFTNPGSYNTQLIVTSSNGCIDSITKIVDVNPLPQINFSSTNPAGCPGHCVTFTNNTSILTGSIVSHYWYFDQGDTLTSISPTTCIENTSLNQEDYDVYYMAVSDKGCTSDTIMYNYINIYPAVSANFDYSPDEIYIVNGEVDFTDLSQVPNTWSWDFGDGTGSNNENPFHKYNDTGFFQVSLVVENSYGCIDSINRGIEIIPQVFFYAPNAFTPNGDMINDEFIPQGYCILPDDYNMYIFDRWGELVFETTVLFGSWNGIDSRNGSMCKSDVYVVKILYRDFFNQRHQYVGHINLLR
jgi:gliding motility-associated-like protein